MQHFKQISVLIKKPFHAVIMLRSISQQWEIYIDQIQSQHFRNFYHAGASGGD